MLTDVNKIAPSCFFECQDQKSATNVIRAAGLNKFAGNFQTFAGNVVHNGQTRVHE